MVPFVYADKVVMGVVGPGGAELDFPIILIMSACLKSSNCSFSNNEDPHHRVQKSHLSFFTHAGGEHSDLVHGAELETTS